jgi:hypothetical protein
MSMTLVLAAISPVNFDQLKSDPMLLRWVHERATLDWSTTLRAYVQEPGGCEAIDLERMERVDGFALRPEDFSFIDYLAVSRWLGNRGQGAGPPDNRDQVDAVMRAMAGDPSALQAFWGRRLSQVVAAMPTLDSMFVPEGELEYEMGYGNCLFWSPGHFSEAVTKDGAWLAVKEREPDVQRFLKHALAKRSYVVGLLY